MKELKLLVNSFICNLCPRINGKKYLWLKASFSTNEQKINLMDQSQTEIFIRISKTNKYVECYGHRSFSITSSSVKVTPTRHFKSHLTMMSATMNVQRECRW
jgi:hypothetical protein